MLTAATRDEPKTPARHPDDSESRPGPGDPRSRRRVSGSGTAETTDRSHRYRPQQRLPPREHAAAAAVYRQPEREQRLHPRPDGLAAVTPLRAHRAGHVLSSLPGGSV